MVLSGLCPDHEIVIAASRCEMTELGSESPMIGTSDRAGTFALPESSKPTMAPGTGSTGTGDLRPVGRVGRAPGACFDDRPEIRDLLRLSELR
jgi:hypothetical protein